MEITGKRGNRYLSVDGIIFINLIVRNLSAAERRFFFFPPFFFL